MTDERRRPWHPSRRPASEVPEPTPRDCNALANIAGWLAEDPPAPLIRQATVTMLAMHGWIVPRRRRTDQELLATVVGAARRFHW